MEYRVMPNSRGHRVITHSHRQICLAGIHAKAREIYEYYVEHR